MSQNTFLPLIGVLLLLLFVQGNAQESGSAKKTAIEQAQEAQLRAMFATAEEFEAYQKTEAYEKYKKRQAEEYENINAALKKSFAENTKKETTTIPKKELEMTFDHWQPPPRESDRRWIVVVLVNVVVVSLLVWWLLRKKGV